MPVKASCRYSWRGWKFTSSGEENHSGCWQVLQTQRFTQLIKKRKKEKQGFCLFFLWHWAISACTLTDGGLLVVRGPSGWQFGPPLQSYASGSKALCGAPVEFKCQFLWSPAAISLLLLLIFFNLPPSLLLVLLPLSLSLSLFPPYALPRCLSGLVISCHPL